MLANRDRSGLLVEQRDGVVTLTLNRPERLNAWDGGMRYAIRDVINEVRDDDDARALLITGAGRGFSSGADLGAEDRRNWPTRSDEPTFAWCLELLHLQKPTIAAINGVAAGGGLGLALLCDIRICSSAARLLPIWMKRAIHPDDLVTWTLPRQAGYSRALKWLYLAEEIPLAEAAACGLIEPVVAPEELLPTCLALAQRLAAGPTTHYALAKQAVLRGLTRDAYDGAMLESFGADKAKRTQDAAEGAAAFRERREPRFSGR
jgi:2-(1,2-epoxy-1,2-dihydrophenyl)acetyl-CoA isomerase